MSKYIELDVRIRLPKSTLKEYEYDKDDEDSYYWAVGEALNDACRGATLQEVEIEHFEIRED